MKFLVSLFLVCTGLTVTAQPGTLDNSFGTGGKVIENFSVPYVNIVDAVLQTDGKTVVLAEAEYNHLSHIALVRYNTNGTLDNTFSGDGTADSPLQAPAISESPVAIRLQADGKILVCGTLYTADYDKFVARYNTDGSLDATFGGTGMITIPDAGVSTVKNLVPLPGGQVVLLGRYDNYPAAEETFLIKLNNDGSRNNSFGTNGLVAINASTALNNYSADFSQIEIQSDGKFVIGGNPGESDANDNDIDFKIVRIHTNGTIDNTYGTNGGISFVPGTAESHHVTDMTIQPDGKIIATGNGDNYLHSIYTFITRINTNGTKDNSFGTNGLQYIANNRFEFSGHISLQSDNKILLGGFTLNALGNYNMTIARLTVDGILDGSFDSDGIALLNVNNYGSYGVTPLQQSDGRIVLAGYAGNGYIFSTTIGRFTTSGQTDATINAGSTAIAYIGSGKDFEESHNIFLQPDQKILNIINRGNGFSLNLGLSRHLPNGTPDTGFGINGRTVIDLPGYANRTFSNLLTNGKILAVADYLNFLYEPMVAVLRFNANGFPDSSFGTNGKLFFTTASGASCVPVNAVVQPNGKSVIIVSELINIYQGATTVLVRLNADGSYDNTFNGSGKLVLSTPSDNISYGGLLVQTDDKIVLSGSENGNAFIKRLHVNGSTDNSFNNGSPVLTPVYASVNAVQPDGKIVLADRQSKLIRLNSNGSFDTSFDGDGIAEPVYSFGAYGKLTDIEIQPDGKILLSGSITDTANNERLQIVRIQPNGSLDSTFGTNGITRVSFASNKNSYTNAMALQADDKILLSGYSEDKDLYYSDLAMVRLNNSNITPGITYTFTGNGDWSDVTNWSNNAIPPAILPSGSTIFIDPVAGGECSLTVIQHVSAGATFTVKTGKKFRIAGGLILQQ